MLSPAPLQRPLIRVEAVRLASHRNHPAARRYHLQQVCLHKRQMDIDAEYESVSPTWNFRLELPQLRTNTAVLLNPRPAILRHWHCSLTE